MMDAASEEYREAVSNSERVEDLPVYPEVVEMQTDDKTTNSNDDCLPSLSDDDDDEQLTCGQTSLDVVSLIDSDDDDDEQPTTNNQQQESIVISDDEEEKPLKTVENTFAYHVPKFITYLVEESDVHEENKKPINNTKGRLETTLHQLSDRRGKGGSMLLEDVLSPDNVSGWFQDKLNTSIPGTLNASVCTLKKFIKFLAQRTKAPEMKQTFDHSVSRLDDFSRRLAKRMRVRRLRQQTTERRNLLTKQDVVLYETSDHVTETLRRLEVLDEGDRPTTTFAQVCRNVLLTLLLFRSVQRSGCLAGLTMGEFKAVERVQQQGTQQSAVVLSVSHHKTFHVYGYARLVLEEWLYQLMDKYKRYLRPLSKNFDVVSMNADDSPFFITRNSTPMDNGYVSTAIVSSWKRAQVPRRFISVTNFRKVRFLVVGGCVPTANNANI